MTKPADNPHDRIKELIREMESWHRVLRPFNYQVAFGRITAAEAEEQRAREVITRAAMIQAYAAIL